MKQMVSVGVPKYNITYGRTTYLCKSCCQIYVSNLCRFILTKKAPILFVYYSELMIRNQLYLHVTEVLN